MFAIASKVMILGNKSSNLRVSLLGKSLVICTIVCTKGNGTITIWVHKIKMFEQISLEANVLFSLFHGYFLVVLHMYIFCSLKFELHILKPIEPSSNLSVSIRAYYKMF
jgi:hypothetical protein